MRISPHHGYFETVFYIDATQSEIDILNTVVTVSSGEIQVVQANILNRVISVKLHDSVSGVKTITLTDGTITDTVDLILEIPHNADIREDQTLQDARRPAWPYRTH